MRARWKLLRRGPGRCCSFLAWTRKWPTAGRIWWKASVLSVCGRITNAISRNGNRPPFAWCARTEEPAGALVPAVESAFARLNRHVRGLQRALRTRVSELEAADRHIAKLEGKLLKLKEAKRELKQLKQEKQALRKSPERKVGQVLLAPYRLPQKLVREVRKRFPGSDKARRASHPANEYQKWLEPRLVKSDEIAALRDGIAQFRLPALHQHYHPRLQHPGRLADGVRGIGARSGLRKMGADPG